MSNRDLTEGRRYLAVNLRSDEAAYLAREAGNRGQRPCCPHLDVFHQEGRTADGGTWRTCLVSPCACHKEVCGWFLRGEKKPGPEPGPSRGLTVMTIIAILAGVVFIIYAAIRF